MGIKSNFRNKPIKIVAKEWGREIWMVNTDLYCLKHNLALKGNNSSLHYHRKKDETFCIISGILEIVVDGKVFELNDGDYIRIPPLTWHQFRSKSGMCGFYEVSTHHDDRDTIRKTRKWTGKEG